MSSIVRVTEVSDKGEVELLAGSGVPSRVLLGGVALY